MVKQCLSQIATEHNEGYHNTPKKMINVASVVGYCRRETRWGADGDQMATRRWGHDGGTVGSRWGQDGDKMADGGPETCWD
jgi:hypothetical protein